MPNTLTMPSNSSEAFESAMKALTPRWMTKELGYSLTHIYRMAANKKTNEEKRRDPFCMAELIVKGLVDMGQKRLAVAIVDRMAQAIGGKLVFTNVTPDKKDIREELLDDLPYLTEQHKAILGGAPIEVVREKTRELHREIDENMAAYEAEYIEK